VPSDPSTYRELAERAWAWVLTQVRRDAEGVWLAEHPEQTMRGEFAVGMHSGVGGLAHAMAELRLTRPLTAAEAALGGEICESLVDRISKQTAYDYFDGLTSTIGVLIALDAKGADLAVGRLRELATPDGWPSSWIEPPRAAVDGRCNDATLGTAGVLTGTDREKVVELPDLTRMKSEVIVQKAHRFGYEHAVRNCGVRLVEVETADDGCAARVAQALCGRLNLRVDVRAVPLEALPRWELKARRVVDRRG